MSVSAELAPSRGDVRLRPYQEDAIARAHARIASGVRRLLVVAPTGSGKTTIAADLIRTSVSAGQRVLFVAHRRELILQAYHRLLQQGLSEPTVGVIMANDPRRRPTAPVQVASIDTLRSRAKPPADLVFVDECHRALAKSYRDLATHYERAVHLGLTATPYRADGRGLGDAYDELLVVASPRLLITEGFLVEPRVFTVPPSARPDLTGVRVKGGDYDEAALARAVDRQNLVGNLVEHWHRHARGLRTVTFAVSVAHSRHIMERFRDAGVAAEHLDGLTPIRERDAILGRLDAGDTQVVCNVGVLAEGWDQPAVKALILARPTKSTGLYLQQAGRILRPWNGTGAVILDHGGCALEHGLPQDDRTFSLETRPRHASARVAPVRTCPSCYAVLRAAARICPACGAELVSLPELPEESAEQLVEMETTRAGRERAEWDRLRAIAATKGYKPAWAYYRFREVFGRSPPRFSKAAGDRRALFESLRRREPSLAWAAARYHAEVGEAVPESWR